MGECTIVIATRDRHEQLRVTTARHRALPERPRVIVVDDGSTPPVALDDVEVIRLDAGLGAPAPNARARAAETAYVAFTDDDAWWAPGALRRAVDLLDAHPRLALVQAHVLVGRDERDDPTCAAMADSPILAADGQPGHPILSFVACAVVVRRDAFLD